MKQALMLMVVTLMIALPAVAADNTIKGKLDIQFNSRVQTDDSGTPTVGVKDVYTFDLTVLDTLGFQGTIQALPTILTSRLGSEKQKASLDYNLNLIVANPANLSQKKTVGKLVGQVQVDKQGVYHFDEGTVRIAIDPAGAARGFESNFRGKAVGKAPKSGSLVERAKKQAQTITRKVQGKTVSLVVKDYDIMTLQGLVLAAGPVQSYPETTVNGEMMYDYERSAWYFRNLSMTYQSEGKTVTDKLSGNIKWVESPQRKSNGQGQYDFDVRFNEPEQASSEATVFQKADDEAAFFATDTKLPSLTGTAKYVDKFRGETVTSSAVTIDLTGNNINKNQVANAFKLVWLVAVVPVNAE
jgi:hypothetical protein